MSNYLTHMQKTRDKTTFSRRVSYLKYNYSSYLRQVVNKRGKVLEVGPGSGELLHILNHTGITGIDILDNDQAVLNHCKKSYNINKAIHAKSDNPIKQLSSKYDLIVLTQVFEHLPKASYQPWVKDLYKLLKPGGNIIITVPNGANPLSGTERYGDLQHENIFTINSLKELLTFADLKNSSYVIRGFEIPPVTIVNLVRILLQKILHLFFILLMMINGAIYQTLMTPNITLIITKKI